jgi:hypothetical protein
MYHVKPLFFPSRSPNPPTHHPCNPSQKLAGISDRANHQITMMQPTFASASDMEEMVFTSLPKYNLGDAPTKSKQDTNGDNPMQLFPIRKIYVNSSDECRNSETSNGPVEAVKANGILRKRRLWSMFRLLPPSCPLSILGIDVSSTRHSLIIPMMKTRTYEHCLKWPLFRPSLRVLLQITHLSLGLVLPVHSRFPIPHVPQSPRDHSQSRK